MNIIERLSSSMGRRDEVPNQELAREIVEQNDAEAIESLVELLQNGKKPVQQDCIKVLYEIGAVKPELITPHFQVFRSLLRSSNNRLQWGTMTALGTLSSLLPKELFNILPEIINTAEKGSVISRDEAMKILVSLASEPQLRMEALPLLMEQLLKSPVNQFPMYAELARPVIEEGDFDRFTEVLEIKMQEIEKESKRKRVEKVLRSLNLYVASLSLSHLYLSF